ncbi:hypothetical protein E2I00_007634, partial [Balaenoptera physalus]
MYACDGHEHVLHTFWAATGAGGEALFPLSCWLRRGWASERPVSQGTFQMPLVSFGSRTDAGSWMRRTKKTRSRVRGPPTCHRYCLGLRL